MTTRHDVVGALAANAERNGVEVLLRKDGALKVPGEAVTDPVAYTLALALAAARHGAELRTGFGWPPSGLMQGVRAGKRGRRKRTLSPWW